MSTYTIIEYTGYRHMHKIKSDFDGGVFLSDLFVDSSFKNSPLPEGASVEDINRVCAEMVGMPTRCYVV